MFLFFSNNNNHNFGRNVIAHSKSLCVAVTAINYEKFMRHMVILLQAVSEKAKNLANSEEKLSNFKNFL